MSLVDKVDTICLTVSNTEKASNWYQEMLGLTETFRGENYRILSVGNGGIPLTIEEGEVNNSHHQVYPIFYSKNIDELHKKLKEAGVKVSEIQHDKENNFFDFYDLVGNKLQVCYWE